ncbi:MAG: hypothetical protein M3Y27_01375 [Acidobacteriota bacterium]|nr:hypothetical protein [Acidobacteriota bacterium]
MVLIASLATEKLRSILAGDEGVRATLSIVDDLEGVSLVPFQGGQVIAQNASPDLTEHSSGSKYPILYVYCSKLLNILREKFRTFSGEAQMIVEVRVSQDRLDDLETRVQMYVDAVIQVLDQNRGDWGDGVFYGGTYEVIYGAAKHGGRNFIQIAKISFAVEISVS